MNMNDPAFPCAEETFPYPGLTKRELFAAMAMQGILARGVPQLNPPIPMAASLSVDYADALVIALSKEHP